MNPQRFPSTILWPLTIPYGAAARLRADCYRAGILRQRRLDGVAISVGNLTTGGTGKTPMTLWIAERLAAEGKCCAILTRGYGGEKSMNGVGSDEVQLLRAHLGDRAAVGVSADRFAKGRELASRGVRWFVLDDGFQHMQLARDVDIVLIDATNPFGGGLLPAGRSREPRSALSRADVVVITRAGHAPAVEAVIQRESNARIFYSQPELDSVRVFNSSEARGDDPGAALALVHARKFFAFCGIGNPSAFRADLRRWGFQIAGFRAFRDHHRYDQREIDALERDARSAGADGLICTEKDAFNLSGVRACGMDVFYCVISLRVYQADEFWGFVKALAAERTS